MTENALPIQELIHARLADLTPAERRVARAILADYPLLALRSTSVIADEANTSPATVVRFVAKLGFDGLPAFHDAVRNELDRATQSPFALYQPPSGDVSPSVAAAESVLSLVTAAMQRLSPTQVADAVDALMAARRVWVAGGRFSQGIAHTLFAHLNLLRPEVRLLGPWPLPIADQIAHSGRDELAVVFDFRRYDPTAEFIASHFARSRGQAIVVTDPYLSPAAQYSAHTFVVPVEGHGLVDSYTGALAVVDVLIATMVAKDERRMAQRSAGLERARQAADEITHNRRGYRDHL